MKTILALAIVVALACAALVALAAEPRSGSSQREGGDLASGPDVGSEFDQRGGPDLRGGPLRSASDSGPALRVCSDPNNLPFSNARGEGFENRIADLLARDLGTHVEYTWSAQRRGFLRNTLNAGACDVVIGYPAGAEIAQTTAPYYRSTYMFVTRRGLRIDSLDDPRLHTLRVGVQLIGDDGANSPPAHALSRRGVIQNVVGYTVYGDYRTDSPPSAIVAAVARGDIDVAAVWGPLAGFFAARQAVPLDLTPVRPDADAQLPQTFAIAMAVRRHDTNRLARLERFLRERRRDIDGILAAYRVPRVD
ncbi:MAG TPA: quinoprotein dehydrogenase-associated putative ABC transporter substrate-binding protein [Vicinamibacterales bacterium]|nr:quinoprotein dehydrogenase-associated putative ABC transporter substrate-binding protein [Vicinamibacterales bacterium]